MVKFFIKISEKQKEEDENRLFNLAINRVPEIVKLDILDTNLNKKQVQELQNKYQNSDDLYSFMQFMQNHERYNQNFDNVQFKIEDEQNVQMKVKQKQFFQDIDLYNGFGINFILPNVIQNFNQLIIQGNLKPTTENFQIKSLDLNLKYFIPQGTLQNKNNISLFFINRLWPTTLKPSLRYSKFGIQIQKTNQNHELYYKFKSYKSKYLQNGNLVYQYRSSMIQDLQYNLKFQLDKNFTLLRKIILTYNSLYRDINIQGQNFSILNFSRIGVCNYKTLFDQKSFTTFLRHPEQIEVAFQNNLNFVKNYKYENFYMRACLFNQIQLYRSTINQNIKKSMDMGINLGLRYGQNLFINFYINLLNDTKKKRFLFLIKFKNDVDQLCYDL